MKTEKGKVSRSIAERDKKFKKTVRVYYKAHGRHDLEWRQTRDPYRILVSEIMLQQTQVPRVREKYKAFIHQFPTIRSLAKAPLGSVLRAWQGLGYNRRAKLLHACAQEVVQTGLPSTFNELVALSGIGPYTAGAVLAFAYNQPVPIIETNIRTVYIHHYFKNKTGVSDADVLACVERTLDRKNPRAWYAALMDYGSYLKQIHGNPNTRSRGYVRQSKFKGSDREIRGAIIRELASAAQTLGVLRKKLSDYDATRLETQIQKLKSEGLVIQRARTIALP